MLLSYHLFKLLTMKQVLRFYCYYACIIPFLINYICAQSIFTNNISLNIIDERIINSDLLFQNTKIGGLSSINYINNRWIAIGDDTNKPISLL